MSTLLSVVAATEHLNRAWVDVLDCSDGGEEMPESVARFHQDSAPAIR
ncbi:hypothetical protein [Nocardia fluminea]